MMSNNQYGSATGVCRRLSTWTDRLGTKNCQDFHTRVLEYNLTVFLLSWDDCRDKSFDIWNNVHVIYIPLPQRSTGQFPPCCWCSDGGLQTKVSPTHWLFSRFGPVFGEILFSRWHWIRRSLLQHQQLKSCNMLLVPWSSPIQRGCRVEKSAAMALG